MKYLIVVVRDRVADVFGQPSFVLSLGSAVRSFGDEVNRDVEGNAFFKHPDDFDLYALGSYDDADASFVVGVPRQVAIGKDLKVRGNGGV